MSPSDTLGYPTDNLLNQISSFLNRGGGGGGGGSAVVAIIIKVFYCLSPSLLHPKGVIYLKSIGLLP